MTDFVQWIKNIAIFYIVASLIIHLIPGKAYQKYIRVFLGIITIILIMNPIARIFSLEGDFDDYLSKNYNLQMEEELKNELEIVGMMQAQVVIDDFVKPIQTNIKEYVEGLGITYVDSAVTIDTNSDSENYGKITNILVYISYDSAQSKELIEIEIKKYLANFYNLDRRNINVNISNTG